MKRILLIGSLVCGMVNMAFAQHDHKHDTVPKKVTPIAKDTTKKMAKDEHAGHMHEMPRDTTKKPAQQMPDMHHMEQPMPGMQHDMQAHEHGEHNMSHAYAINLPMNRNGSGTGWLPDASPMYGYMFHKNSWMYMLHGNLFLRYNSQDALGSGSRGGSKFDAPNWAMLMGQRKVGTKGLFHFSMMGSLDPVIAGESGYPLLYQTGETFNDKPLIDRQHPHDLFSELSVSYAHALSSKADVFVYVGYPGEPAIGPVAFMHRPSALNNPDATLTHHWTDATHITFGVATLGVRVGDFKLEGSSFTGREPDENRYNFDKPRFDSWSGRLSYNPTENWAAQLSHGLIKQPELLHPGEDVKRTTASVTYSKRGFLDNYFNATALWGVNKKGEGDGEHGVLLEGAYTQKRWSVYSRYEWVQKSGEELQLDENIFDHHDVFPVHAITAGFNYDLFNIGHTKFAAGGHLTFFDGDDRLNYLYGQNPIGTQVYLRIYPGVMGKKDGGFFLPY